MDDTHIKYLQTKESLEFALESGRMATWDFDLVTNHISCSQEMLDLWGIEPHEFKHERSILQNKVHPDDLNRMNAEINKAIENRTIYELEYRIIPRAGQIRWVLSRGRCTYNPGSLHPTRMAGIVYDITEKKNKEVELARALEAKSEFFSIAGHELKTPLTCLNLQLKVMECQLEEISQNAGSVELIQHGLKKQSEQLHRISRIVDNILDESKISKGLFTFKIETCDLTQIIASVLEQISLISNFKGIEINFSRPSGISGKWDRYRLEQVLINLLMNAIHYGNNGPIHLEIIEESEQVLLSVRDQGHGISPEDQVRVFQRFERVNPDKSVSGMGLGLYIANYIVQAHGGEIRLKSETGKGSEFTVAIPYDSSAINIKCHAMTSKMITDIKRYPVRKNETLQGWDSADELILHHMKQQNLSGKRILIINDQFGALSCGLEGFDCTTYTDSYVSMMGISHNSHHKIQPINQLAALNGFYDYVLIQIPKNMSFFEDTLCHLTQHLHAESKVICGSMVKHLAPTSFDLLNKYIGKTSTSLAQKKARLVFADFEKTKVQSPYPLNVKVEAFEFPFTNNSNLFSRDKLDIGTRFFLEHTPRGDYKAILDLGCANGIIGIMAKTLNPAARISFSDDSAMAIESARINYDKYFKDEASYFWTNCFENQPKNSLDLVLCNPPFHQGNTIGDFIAWQMFQDAYAALKTGGTLRVIGNSHLGYQVKLKKLFGNSLIVATNSKFIIWDARK